MIDIEVNGATVEAILATPPAGSGPGVLLFMDAYGLRPRIEEMASEIAGWGYVVLAPNVFYREGTVADLSVAEDLADPDGRQRLWRRVGPRVGRLTVERALPDIDGYVAALLARPEVTSPRIGVVGFCMGARLAVRAAGRRPEAVAACAGFHGGGLVTDAPDSPHLALADATAEFLFGHADGDPSLTPQNCADLGAALAGAGLVARNEIYPGAPHGYTMADTSAWNPGAYRRAFSELRGLFDRTLQDGPGSSDPIDRRLLQDPYITLFRSPAVLDDALRRLRGSGYDVRTADASQWVDQQGMHRALAALLDFPDYYGNNLDALNDCLGDVAAGGYGVDTGATGLVLVLRRYDAFAATHRDAAFAVLDIFAVTARAAALRGRPMLCLVQSDDPDLDFPPVGAVPVSWNGAEWLRARRGDEPTV